MFGFLRKFFSPFFATVESETVRGREAGLRTAAENPDQDAVDQIFDSIEMDRLMDRSPEGLAFANAFEKALRDRGHAPSEEAASESPNVSSEATAIA